MVLCGDCVQKSKTTAGLIIFFIRKPVLGVFMESVKLQKSSLLDLYYYFLKILQENVILRVKHM